ncbi:unnamed protein product [Cylicostephanus goldi]|uniref:Uncharacterized protein n=1 Tax=Cylicostephanus goldi TaxID=71465 RepID=A0A3P7QCL1_CYLGO|nr:unnamed protein product [Cylicostephanus goldi]
MSAENKSALTLLSFLLPFLLFLTVLNELRDLQKSLRENLRNSTFANGYGDLSSTSFAESPLSSGLKALGDAIQLVESTLVLHPNKLSEIRAEQIGKCSKLLCCSYDSKEEPANVSTTSFYQRISTPRSKDTLDVGSLDFLLTLIPNKPPHSELLQLVESMSPMDSPEQRLDSFLKAAAIITTILYE